MANNTNRPQVYQKLSYMQKLANYNQRKRNGDVTTLADRTGYSTTHVSDVLNGKYSNDRIMNAAYDRGRGRQINVQLVG